MQLSVGSGTPRIDLAYRLICSFVISIFLVSEIMKFKDNLCLLVSGTMEGFMRGEWTQGGVWGGATLRSWKILASRKEFCTIWSTLLIKFRLRLRLNAYCITPYYYNTLLFLFFNKKWGGECPINQVCPL